LEKGGRGSSKAEGDPKKQQAGGGRKVTFLKKNTSMVVGIKTKEKENSRLGEGGYVEKSNPVKSYRKTKNS